MTKSKHHGFTLIELIIFIVMVAAGLAGILSVMNTVVASSADPMVRKQAVALADSILEEILLKSFCDPDTVNAGTNPPTCGANTVESGRDTYDDVDDYDGKNETLSLAGPIFLGLPAELYGYRVQVAVAAATLGVIPVKSVTVTVSRGTESVTMTGFRGNY